ncbi:hypothetical protein CJF30_00010814 [Rutstroemia sp. NJR-2017a BBW]|nr:hypothetical protein CJF30_00010814 [Rutstroemia sp. NJR-2017a BBW]
MRNMYETMRILYMNIRKEGFSIEVDTSKRTEESQETLYHRLEKDIKWMGIVQN